MMKKLTALAALVVLLLTQRPYAQASGARIFFVDVGQGAATLIVSPGGKTLLVDGGPPGSGATIISLLDTLGLRTIDYTVVTHYHIDHMGGMIEVLNAGRVAGVAFDNGDGPDVQPPGTSTSSTSTRGTYINYVAATAHAGVTRQTAVPGTFLDFGDGMRATFIAAGGRLLSGGRVAITTDDLNSESVSTLIEYNNFDYLVSGDLTGGGSTSTAKTPDVETYVGQMVGDVDVVQLDHHGSTTANNQTFLTALKAEVAFAQTGEANTFGHPNRETTNKYLNTPDTIGNSNAGTGVPVAGNGPVFYQNETSPAGDDRVTQQGYTGAAAGNAGQGTIVLSTDGTTNYSLRSFGDGGVRLNPVLHTYLVDGVSPGITTDFPPTVVVQATPAVPLATESVTVSAAVNDDRSPISSVTLAYRLNGAAQSPVAMALSGGVYQATIPAQPDGVRVDYAVTATAGDETTTFSLGYFAGTTPISALRVLNAKGEPLYAGYAARVLGTVTASGFSGPGTNDDYVQDPTGAINVYRTTNTPTPFVPTTPGQTVEVRGRIGFNGGRLRLDIMESIEKTTSPYGIAIVSGGPAPTPVTTTIAAINSNPESFEGQFVSMTNVSIVSGTIPATPQSIDAFVTVTDGTGTFSLKIDDDTDIEGFTPAATFTAVGIIQQDDFLRPFDAGYDITPRSRVDIGGAPPPVTPLLTIADARVDHVNNANGTPGGDFIPDRVGQTVTIHGAVTSIDFRAGSTAGMEYYVQDATGGLDLFSTSLNPAFEIGDNVEAIGVVTHFNGLTELTVTSVAPLGGSTVTAPAVVTLAQLGNGGAGEAFEGRLVRIDNVLITSGSFPAANGTGNLTITDATGTGTMRVDSDTDIDGSPTPAGVFSVTGVVGQFAAAPFDGGYQLLPRFLDDIVDAGCLPITIDGALPGGTVGTPYGATLSASGGTGPFSFSIASGTAPNGVTLSTAGVLAGTPTGGGTFTFSVRAVAADGCLGVASRIVTIVNLAPALSATPATLAFGSVALGASTALGATLTNTGSSPLVMNVPLTITGADAGLFQVVSPPITTLAPGTSTSATVSFLPTTAGPKSATLTITSNGGVATVALTGIGAASTTGGGIVISEFRTRGTAGTGANDEFVEIYNNSDAPIDISGYRLVGSNNAGGGTTNPRATVPAGVVLPGRAHYLFVNTTATTGYSLPVPGNRGYGTGITDDGGVAIFDATGKTPLDAVGMSTGSAFKEGATLAAMAGTSNQSYQRRPGGQAITLQDTGDNSADFQLLNGVAPNLPNPQNVVLTSAPVSVDFGGVLPPESRSQAVTIGNLLLTAVTLDVPAVVSGDDAPSFSVGAPSTTTLTSGATATIAVAFEASTTGAKKALLTISSTSAGSVTVPLSGTGLPGISVSPTSLDFGAVASGSAKTEAVVITNGNPADVTLTLPFAITGTDAAAFSVTAPASATLAPAGDTTTTVTFQPTSLGNKSAALVVTSTNGGTRTIALSGLSSCPAISVTGTLPNAEFGAPYSRTLSASGGGGGPFTFAIASGGLPSGVTLDPSGTLSGTPGALGGFRFTAEATAANGCTGSASFTVTVADTTAPALLMPANITIEATGATTVVTFAPLATDTADASPVISCTPSSGSAFAVATTTVRCTATDAHGNSTSGSFSVIITDHTAPSLMLPGDLAATATSPSGAVVTYSASATDLVDGVRTLACSPASGSTFAIGTTLVSCSTSDAHGNAATGSFNVTVATAAQPGRMIGDGNIEVGAVTHSFAFFVQERANGADASAITYRVKTSQPGRDRDDRFDAVAVTGVTFFNVPGVSPGPQPPSGVDTVMFSGTGRWNRRSGYTFDARAIDAGEPGRGRDAFAITIRDGAGHIVAAVDATIVSGNIQSLRITR